MKVGDYVRTKNGKIVKCFKSESMNKPMYYVIDSATNSYIEYQDVIKSSPNIIDLIEVGDYVNGCKVDFSNIDKKLTYEDKCIGFYDGDGDITLFEKDIKSIVTKEQFEMMNYKIGE